MNYGEVLVVKHERNGTREVVSHIDVNAVLCASRLAFMSMPAVHCPAPQGAVHANYTVTETSSRWVIHGLPCSELWHYLYSETLDK